MDKYLRDLASNGDDKRLRVIIVTMEAGELLGRLLEHEIMNSCCFPDEFDRIDIKQKLIDLYGKFDV